MEKYKAMDENVKQQVLAKKDKLIKTWKVKKKEKCCNQFPIQTRRSVSPRDK